MGCSNPRNGRRLGDHSLGDMQRDVRWKEADLPSWPSKQLRTWKHQMCRGWETQGWKQLARRTIFTELLLNLLFNITNNNLFKITILTESLHIERLGLPILPLSVKQGLHHPGKVLTDFTLKKGLNIPGGVGVGVTPVLGTPSHLELSSQPAQAHRSPNPLFCGFAFN